MKQSLWHTLRWAAVMLIALWLVGCDGTAREAKGAKEAQDVSPYPVLDSGVTASTKSGDKIYWMDNERVIFVSYGPKPKTVEEKQRIKPDIFIWDTRANKVTGYRAGANTLCYYDGYIRYADHELRPVPGTEFFVPRIYAGPLGKERIVNAEVFEKGGRDGERDSNSQENPYTCRYVERPRAMAGKIWMPLLEQHGALDLEAVTVPGVPEMEQPIIYHRASDGEAIALDLKRRDVGAFRYYIAYRDAYFFRENVDGTKFKTIDCIRYWWISGDGKIERGCQSILPFKKWKGGAGGLYPTRQGMILAAGKLEDYDAGTAALYLMNEDHAQRVITGGIEHPSLSPDGCKLAFVHVPFYEAKRVGVPGDLRLKIINFCSK